MAVGGGRAATVGAGRASSQPAPAATPPAAATAAATAARSPAAAGHVKAAPPAGQTTPGSLRGRETRHWVPVPSGGSFTDTPSGGGVHSTRQETPYRASGGRCGELA